MDDLIEPVTDLEVDWSTISSAQIAATLNALVPLVTPNRNMALIAEAAERIENLEASVTALTHERNFHRETADLHADRIATRPRGYVTEAMCQRYGSFARALEALNKAGGDMQRVMAEAA